MLYHPSLSQKTCPIHVVLVMDEECKQQLSISTPTCFHAHCIAARKMPTRKWTCHKVILPIDLLLFSLYMLYLRCVWKLNTTQRRKVSLCVCKFLYIYIIYYWSHTHIIFVYYTVPLLWKPRCYLSCLSSCWHWIRSIHQIHISVHDKFLIGKITILSTSKPRLFEELSW